MAVVAQFYQSLTPRSLSLSLLITQVPRTYGVYETTKQRAAVMHGGVHSNDARSSLAYRQLILKTVLSSQAPEEITIYFIGAY